MTLVEGSDEVHIAAGESTVKPLHLFADPATFKAGKITARVEIADEDGHKQILTCPLFGPGARS